MIDLGRRDGRLLRIGHRGAAALAPENSLEAIALAVELGCDLVEFDVHAIGDALVVVHDRPQDHGRDAVLFRVQGQNGSRFVGVPFERG